MITTEGAAPPPVPHLVQATGHDAATVRAWLAGAALAPAIEARIARLAWLGWGYRRAPPAQTTLALG